MLRNPGPDGKGISIEKGDKFIIPEGYLKISANPLRSSAHFTKEGLDWFAQFVFVGDFVKKRKRVLKELINNEKECVDILMKSELVKGLNPKNPKHAEEIFHRLENHKSSLEWWAYLRKMFIEIIRKALHDNNQKRALWAMGCAERCRSMIIFKNNFEEVVWMGQSARRIVEVINAWHANKKNSNETFWQNLFKENPYVLSQIFAVPVVFIHDKVYVGGMNVDRKNAKLVDYLYTAESSSDALLVEIKTPITRLLGPKYRGIYRPSSELSGSIIQVLDYRRELARNFKQITEGTNKKIEIFEPKCIIIAGNYKDQISNELRLNSFELFRANLRNVEIITYDELFRKAETLATLFNLLRTH